MSKRKGIIRLDPALKPPGVYREYIAHRFHGKRADIVNKCNLIIGAYQAQGDSLTLRQLYYRLVAANVIPNKQTEYDNLSAILNFARLGGHVSWTAIEDRTRNLEGLQLWEDQAQIIAASAHSYTIDKWEDQPFRVEVWVEKDALKGVVARACNALQVDYFSCRGYTSQSEMYDAGQRLRRRVSKNQEPVIIHLGDHDPSGRDMTRDIVDRLELFTGGVPVERIALNMAQIEQYKPPPNPAKVTDSRYGKYVDEFGPECWELDALEPPVIRQMITDAILLRRDENLWAAKLEEEAEQRALLVENSQRWPDIRLMLERAIEDENEWDQFAYWAQNGELPQVAYRVPPIPVDPRAIPLVPGAGVIW